MQTTKRTTVMTRMSKQIGMIVTATSSVKKSKLATHDTFALR